MANLEKKSRVDMYIFIFTIALMIFSVGAVYSASSTFAFYKKNDFNFFFKLHLVKVIASIVVLFIGMKINYHRLEKWSKKILVLGILFLGAVFVVGTIAKGATRWIGFSMLSIQPSEFAKFALVIHLAYLLSQKEEYLQDFKTGFMPLVVWIGVVTFLIMIQPNFSTGLMICMISFSMLFAAKVRLKHLFTILLGAIPVIVLYGISAQYRMNRILSFIGMSNTDKSETINYQLQQAIIGFGNGGFFGVGPGQSRQRDLFLPESYGDFIFSVVGEEYGFIGAVAIITIFCLIMYRGFKIAKRAPDKFGKYLAIGITSTISLYAVVNAGVACGLLPTTGLPMPFLSYGGSSMFFTAFAVGILLNISTFTNIRLKEEKVEVIYDTEDTVVGQVF
jgi:cell division protein FtsW